MNLKYSWIRMFVFVLMLVSMIGLSSKYTSAQELNQSIGPESIYNGTLHLLSTPIKILDTRDGYGFLSPGTSYSLYVWGSLRNQVAGTTYLAPPRPTGAPYYYLDPLGVCIGITVITPNGQGNIKIGPSNPPVGIQTTFAPIGMNISNFGCVSTLNGIVPDVSGVNLVPDLILRTQYAGCHLSVFLTGYYY